MNNNIIAIFACHTSCIKKYVTTLNNLYNIYNYIDKFIIIDSSNEQFSNNLINDLKNDPKFLKFYIIPNDIYYDFGKWIYVLQNENLNQFNNILFINDSIILNNYISTFFLYFKDLKKDVNLFAYNDSSQLEVYHYQSYLFIIKNTIISKFINFFNSKKHLISNQKTLIEQLEFNLINVDSNHDVYLKIANNINKYKNIFWENDSLYENLVNGKIFHIFKLKKINDHFKHYQYDIKNIFPKMDPRYYINKYNDLKKVSNARKHFLEYGFNEGRSCFIDKLDILPKYCSNELDELKLTPFFDIPSKFDIYFYKKNTNVQHLSNIECIRHFFDYGNDDNTIFSNNKNDIYEWNKQKNDFYCKQIYNLYKINITIPDDFILYEYLQLNKNNKELLQKGILDILVTFSKTNKKYYSYDKIKACVSIANFKKIFPSLASSSDFDIILFFYEKFNDKEILIELPTDYHCFIYKGLYDDFTYLESDELIKEHYKYIGYFEKRNYRLLDFDAVCYRNYYSGLNKLTDDECMQHYINNGYKEGKTYKLPEDFNYIAYKSYYIDELKDFTKKQLIEHYFSYGHKEKRKYKLPENFNFMNYKKLYSDLNNYSEEECIKHYIIIGEKENRIFNIPNDFISNDYKIIFPNLGNNNEQEIREYFINEGYRINKEYKIDKDFDYMLYKDLYHDLSSLNKYELIYHYYNYGKKEERIYKIPENINLELFREFNEKYINMSDMELLKLLINNNLIKTKLKDLPNNFNVDIYKKLNPDLNKLSDNALIEHFKIFGHNEKRFYEIPENFNHNEYKLFYKDITNLNEIELIFHFLNIGKKEERIGEFPKDFDYNFHRRLYKINKDITNEEIKDNFIKNYSIEKKLYKMPIDFNPQVYIKLNKDLTSISHQDAINHFIDNGFNENRKYKIEVMDENQTKIDELPIDFDPESYRRYNPDLHYYNDNNYLINHYLMCGKKEKRLYKLPKKFSIQNYKNFNKDIQHLTNEKALEHFIGYGINEKRLYDIPEDFDCDFYQKIYFYGKKMTNDELKKHFKEEGYSKGYLYKYPDNFNVYFYRRLNEDLIDLTDEELLYHFIHLGMKEKRPYF